MEDHHENDPQDDRLLIDAKACAGQHHSRQLALKWHERVDAILSSKLPTVERFVLLILNHHLGGNRACWPSQTTLATESGYSRPRISAAIRNLRSWGIIQTRPGKGRSATLFYMIDFPALQTWQPDHPPSGPTCHRGLHVTDDDATCHRGRQRPVIHGDREPKGNGTKNKTRRLVSKKQNQSAPAGKPPAPGIASIIPADLEDTDRLLELYLQAVERGWATPGYLGPAGELSFVSAAVHAQRIVRQHGKGDPVRLFAWFARGLDKPVRSNGTATPDPEQFDIGAWEDEQLAKWENGEDRTNRRSDFITNDDEQIAHRQIKQHRYGELPRGALSLSTDARFVQHFLRVARTHGWHGMAERLYAILKDRLADDWTQQRWDDACAELRDGGGPVHVGKLTATLLARFGVTEPTIRIHDEESVSDTPARQAAG